jgi:hypothetical protein
MLRCFVRSLQEKPVSGENTNSDDANVFELTVDQKYSTHYILSSGYQRAGFRFRHSIGFFSQSSGISSIMHFGMSSGISSRNRYKMGGHTLRLWNYTSYFNFSIDILRTASGIFGSSCLRYPRLATFDLGYSPRGGPSSRTRSTIASADDSSSHRFCSMYEWLLSYPKSPASQEIPASRASKAISTVCHSTATGKVPDVPSREWAQSFVAPFHHIARTPPRNSSPCRERLLSRSTTIFRGRV